MKLSALFIKSFTLFTQALFGLALFYHFIVSPIMILTTINSNQSEGFLITYVGLKPESWKPMNNIQSVNTAITTAGIKYESVLVRLDFSHWRQWLNMPVLLYFLLSFTKGLIVIFILYNLMRIAGHLKRHRIFIASNIRCIRYIGFSLLAIPVLELLSGISIRPFVLSQIKVAGYHIIQPSAIWSVEYQWIFTGILVLVLAQIFNEGIQLQQEKDLTI